MNPMFAIAVGLMSIVAFVQCDECSPTEQAVAMGALVNQTTANVMAMYKSDPSGKKVMDWVQYPTLDDICNIITKAGNDANNNDGLNKMVPLAKKITDDLKAGFAYANTTMIAYNNAADKPGAIIKMAINARVVEATMQGGPHCSAKYPIAVKSKTEEQNRYHCQCQLILDSLDALIPVLLANGNQYWYERHVEMRKYCAELFAYIDTDIESSYTWDLIHKSKKRALSFQLIANFISYLSKIAVRNLGDVSQRCVNKP